MCKLRNNNIALLHLAINISTWKEPKYEFFSGSYFPVFGLINDQKRIRIWTLFHAVSDVVLMLLLLTLNKVEVISTYFSQVFHIATEIKHIGLKWVKHFNLVFPFQILDIFLWAASKWRLNSHHSCKSSYKKRRRQR